MSDNIEELREDSSEDTADKIRAGLKAENTDTNTGAEDDDGEDGNKETKTEEKSKVSDAEAKLLKELMKHKEAAKKAAAEKKALEEKYAGLDVDEIKALLAKREEDETNALEKKGEYDRLLAKQREAADAKIKEALEKAEKAEQDKATLLKQIEALTTGNAFSNSKFVTEKLTLTPAKAKALYGSHFDFVDGKMVAYDKPRGEADRTPIVDATGETVSFEAAIEAIINEDPDKDYLIKADIKPGAASKQSNVEKKPQYPQFADTTDKIAAGLEAFNKQFAKK